MMGKKFFSYFTPVVNHSLEAFHVSVIHVRLSVLQAEMELSKNGTANSSPATISVTSLIKEAERPAVSAAAESELAGHRLNHSGTSANGHLASKQFLTDEYMAKILGDRTAADSGGRVRAQGGRAVRQVLSNNV